jgi:two-component system, OmpR family, sensor histidine kinase ChvG
MNKAPQRGWWARLRWTLGVSLTSRILAVNIIALSLLAGSLFYLDSYRNRLLAERTLLARAEAEIAADALSLSNRSQRRALIVRIGSEQKLRLRLYAADGRLTADSFVMETPSYSFIDPETEPWLLHAARALDGGMDYLIGSPPVPGYPQTAEEKSFIWPEVVRARETKSTEVALRLAPDRTPVINAAAPVGSLGQVLLTTRNATDITQNVRNARQTLALIVMTALIMSVLLSLFLARTIVEPLRLLVRAAVRVRLGRDRQVIVPRLPDRRDEIGLLARAISDMTSVLRSRIDAVESFAADVSHEVKNPLASLRSALESLEKVQDPALRQQLASIAAHDVQRLDRLVTEISDASRIDAELSRTTFEPVDLLELVEALVTARKQRTIDGDCALAISTQGGGPWTVSGDAAKLERVLQNLIDNAVSFSPAGGTVTIKLDRFAERIAIAVADEGLGIPVEAREKVFERFHSLRPDAEDFGNHSGLGLAIARTIVEAHDGTLTAGSRYDGQSGATLLIDLPAEGGA